MLKKMNFQQPFHFSV